MRKTAHVVRLKRGSQKLRTAVNRWLVSASVLLGGPVPRPPRPAREAFSFQRLHTPSGAPAGPGSGSGAGALAYCTQNSTFTMTTNDELPPAMPKPWWTKLTRWRQTSRRQGRDAEHRVLRLFPGLSGPMVASDVAVGPGREDYLHTLSGGPAGVQPPVVMMPGYGAGVGFYYRNFPSLAQRLRLFAVDWLGTGLSGRPPYRAATREQAEDFFLTSLAEWRRAAGLADSKMVLVGHSLGGYLAASYALRHPDHVQHLVLVCPAGVPKQPEDWERRWLGDKWSWRGQIFKTIMWAWEKGITPGGIIRTLGPWGQSIVYKYVANRFAHHGEGLSQREIEVFREYFYSIAALRGSGEYALRHLLAPGAWAHAPLEERLNALKVPVTFIYGKHDWMQPAHAVQLCERLRSERPPRGPNDLAVQIIDDAGHFVFLDQPELFDKALTAVVAPYLATAQQRHRATAYAAEGTAVSDGGGSAVGEGGPVATAGGEDSGVARLQAQQQQPATNWGFAAGGLRTQGETTGPEEQGKEGKDVAEGSARGA